MTRHAIVAALVLCISAGTASGQEKPRMAPLFPDFGFVSGVGYPAETVDEAWQLLRDWSDVMGVPADDVAERWNKEGRQRPAFEVLMSLAPPFMVPARWALIYENDDVSVWVDKTRIEREQDGNYLIWEATSLSKVRDPATGSKYNHYKIQKLVDCKQMRSKSLVLARYYGEYHVDTSAVERDRMAWDIAIPESVGEAAGRATCALLASQRSTRPSP